MALSLGHALHGREVARRELGSWRLSVTRYESESAIPLHTHESPYATVVVRGGYEEVSDGRRLHCVKGSIVVHRSGERHADRFAGATTCLNIHGGRFSMSGLIPPPVAVEIASKLRREFLQPDDVSPQIVEALMLELDALSRRGTEEDRVPFWLREIRGRLETSFREPLAVTALAETAGVHPTHLARSFRRHYGMTVGEMIRERRIDLARKWLGERRSLSEIACELGFADQSHFTRVFRKATGTTPAAYRRGTRAAGGRHPLAVQTETNH